MRGIGTIPDIEARGQAQDLEPQGGGKPRPSGLLRHPGPLTVGPQTPLGAVLPCACVERAGWAGLLVTCAPPPLWDAGSPPSSCVRSIGSVSAGVSELPHPSPQ